MKTQKVLAVTLSLFIAVAGFACGGDEDKAAPTPGISIAGAREQIKQAKAQASTQPTPQQASQEKAQAPASQAPKPTVAPNQVSPKQQQAPAPVSLRRECPQGPCPFKAGEPVVGYRMQIGNLWYGNACYIASAPAEGNVYNGAVYPDPGEILQPCSAGVENLDSVNGKMTRPQGPFVQGEAVVGYNIIINGLTYRLCHMTVAPAGGRVEGGGLINPPLADMNLYPPCGQGKEDPDTVNGKFRRDCVAPKGPCEFATGEAVTGFFTINGVRYDNCFFRSAPGPGTIPTDGGTVNYWPKEIVGVRAC